MEIFAERLKAMRQAQGQSVIDLSLEIGTDSSTIHAWESGKRIPSRASLRKLATALAVSADELQFGDQAGTIAEARKLVAAAAGVPAEKVAIKIKR